MTGLEIEARFRPLGRLVEAARRRVVKEEPRSRFVRLPRAVALGLLALLVGVIALGLPLRDAPSPPQPATGITDIGLDRAVVDRVRRGERYEAAAVSELRAHHYTLRPFPTVRPPALATALSWLPNLGIAAFIQMLLAAAVIFAWTLRLQAVRAGPVWAAWAAIVLCSGVGATMVGGGVMSLLHEAWAGLLIALSLALRTPKRFAVAVILGLCAALIRELAMPYLAVMAVIALAERRRAEGLAFGSALAIALAALALHAQAVSSLVTSHDPASRGWLSLGGWTFVLSTARTNLITPFAGWTAAVIVPLALLGAGAWRGGAGIRLACLLAGYTLGFMVIGRPENDYWGFVTAPLLAVGLCLSPMAIGDLIRRSIGSSRLTA